ncbi:MAG TPA: hypothetical protein VM943_01455 [Pyrinomonadaceae bacterium]|nr:hypothetical protein [Pyrinomonadaceae bacterium]
MRSVKPFELSLLRAGERHQVGRGIFHRRIIRQSNNVGILLPLHCEEQGFEGTTTTQSAGSKSGRQSAAGEDEKWIPLSEADGRYVRRVIEHAGGNKQGAARRGSQNPSSASSIATIPVPNANAHETIPAQLWRG